MAPLRARQPSCREGTPSHAEGAELTDGGSVLSGRDRPGGASVKSTAGEAVQLLGAGAGNATGTATLGLRRRTDQLARM